MRVLLFDSPLVFQKFLKIIAIFVHVQLQSNDNMNFYLRQFTEILRTSKKCTTHGTEQCEQGETIQYT